MIYLLDTNIFSEMGKKQPDPVVVRWLSDTPEHHTCISVISVGEIQAENKSPKFD